MATASSAKAYKAPDGGDIELKVDLGDIELGKILGEGSFSTIYSGKLKQRVSSTHPLRQFGDEFACKVMKLRNINVNRNKAKLVGSIMREKRALYHCRRLKSPFCLSLFATAKSFEKISFISEFLTHGDILQSLTKYGAFDDIACQYYLSCLVHAVDSLHAIGIVHRDLKPENIMLNSRLQPILCDFGCVKIIPHVYNKAVGVEAASDLFGSDSSSASSSSDSADSNDSGDGNADKKDKQDKPRRVSKFRSKFYSREDRLSDPDFVGTPEFMAPELFGGLGVSQELEDDDTDDESEDLPGPDEVPNQEKEKNVKTEEKESEKKKEDGRLAEEAYRALDLWSLGCILYQLSSCKLLFEAGSEWLVFQKVLKMEVEYPQNMSENVKDLITKLLKKKPEERIGYESMDQLKKHSFFDGVEWRNVETAQAPGFNEKHRKEMKSS